MKVLVYPALMEVGGSQLNAVELAAESVRRGHEVVVAGPDGALVPFARSLGLEHVVTPREHTWPNVHNIAFLRRLVAERGIDVVHGYEWGPSVDLVLAAELTGLAPMVTTVLSMSVDHLVPRHAPIVVGTATLLHEQAALRPRAHLIEPPIDTGLHRPREAAGVRARFGLDVDDPVLAVVCRMTPDLGKLAGVLDAITAVEVLCTSGTPVRLLVVGGGTGEAEVRRHAAATNDRLARPAVVVTGELLDPADAYTAADVVLGMGSSVLKGMASGRPVLVQGEDGFGRVLDDESLPGFLLDGWWGHEGDGVDALVSQLRPLLADATRRAELGALGRRVVEERFSLRAAGELLDAVYDDAVRHRVAPRVVRREALRTLREVAKYHVARRVRSAPVRVSSQPSVDARLGPGVAGSAPHQAAAR